MDVPSVSGELVTGCDALRVSRRSSELFQLWQPRLLALVSMWMMASAGWAQTSASPLASESPWVISGARHQLDPLYLYAIALQESRRAWGDGQVRPWPWTLHTPLEGSLYFPSYQAALRKLRELLDAGTTNVDVGLQQISWRFQGYRIGDAGALLEPAQNIELSARILREHLDEVGGDLRLAIARYHNPRPELGLPYAASVLAILDKLRKVEGIRDALAQGSEFLAQE